MAAHEKLSVVQDPMNKLLHAVIFAAEAHKNQRRKYTDEPYINHCIAVAELVSCANHDLDMLCASILHDVREDCGVSNQTILHLFGEGVANHVHYLTDISKKSDGNRAVRKKIDREWIAQAPASTKTIKLADLIDNTRSICKYDPEFAKVYMAEKRLLLEVLKEGDSVLWNSANFIVEDYYAQHGVQPE